LIKQYYLADVLRKTSAVNMKSTKKE